MYVLYELFFFIDNVVCLLSYEHVRLSCVFYSKLTYLLPYLLTYPNRNSNVNFFTITGLGRIFPCPTIISTQYSGITLSSLEPSACNFDDGMADRRRTDIYEMRTLEPCLY